jgi:hypothetical protein
MNYKILQKRSTLNLIGAIILVVGLGSAAFIYQKAGNDLYGEGEDVNAQLIMLQNSKLYRHNLEVFGGKLNVMMYDFRIWFLSLWQGESLAFIIACSSLVIAVGVFYTANYLLLPSNSEGNDENDPEGND